MEQPADLSCSDTVRSSLRGEHHLRPPPPEHADAYVKTHQHGWQTIDFCMARQGVPDRYRDHVYQIHSNRRKLVAMALLGRRELARRRHELRRQGRDGQAASHEDPLHADAAERMRRMSDREIFRVAQMNRARYDRWSRRQAGQLRWKHRVRECIDKGARTLKACVLPPKVHENGGTQENGKAHLHN